MKKIWIFLLLTNIIALNAYAGYNLFAKSESKTSNFNNIDPNSLINNEISSNDSDTEQCGVGCKKYIDEKFVELANTQNLTPTPVNVRPANNVVPKSQLKTVSYLPIPGNGSTGSTSWTDLSGTDFYFTKSDYPGLKETYFEANIKLLNGNGMAHVRIFDKTNGIAVSGSEVITPNQTSTFISSSNLPIWEGYNHYVIQARSLTADTAIFEGGKLKIITVN